MSYCEKCGTLLVERFLENEGMNPYCEHCGQYRFPMFNTAVSMVVYSPDHSKILLIQQYGKARNILVAGYVNKGESAEEAVVREVKEETGLTVVDYRFNKSEYFAKSNTLMVNFACTVDSENFTLRKGEVDRAGWFSVEEARAQIYHDSLAEKFLLSAIEKRLYQA